MLKGFRMRFRVYGLGGLRCSVEPAMNFEAHVGEVKTAHPRARPEHIPRCFGVL